jgi:hypothetical protein
MKASWQENPHRLLAVLVPVFCAIGLFLVRSAQGAPAIKWMYVFDAADFSSMRDLVAYVLNLRVPIPVVLSVAEILNNQVAGNVDFTTRVLYQAALVLVYVVALILASSSVIRLVGSFVLSVVFLWSTVLIHPGNPQTYDIFYPLFVLIYLLLLKLILSKPRTQKPVLIAAGAGVSLALAELSRPFVFLMLPFLLVGAYQTLRHRSRHSFIAFLVPVMLLSGGWHLYQLVRYDQITWSNHTGFNLHRAWYMVETPPLVEESHDAPLVPGRWPNLNTAEHYENSGRLEQAILKYIVAQPGPSLLHAARRFKLVLFEVRTSIYSHRPESGVFLVYRPLVWLSVSWLFVSAVMLLILGLRHKRPWQLLGCPTNMLIVIACLSICFLVLGDADEEARFLISVLPFLAVLPVPRLPAVT